MTLTGDLEEALAPMANRCSECVGGGPLCWLCLHSDPLGPPRTWLERRGCWWWWQCPWEEGRLLPVWGGAGVCGPQAGRDWPGLKEGMLSSTED